MNEILIVPDIHGRNFWEKALDYEGEIVFLGDYTDPYEEEGFTDADAYRGLQKIVQFKQANPERVTLLIGNHEMHYYNDEYQVNRFSQEYYERYHAILTGKETAGLFQIAKQAEMYLFVHAGVTKGWYECYEETLEVLGKNIAAQLNRFFAEAQEVFNEIPYERGGYDKHGSPIWADFWELKDEEIRFDSTVIQIVGHSKIKTPDPIKDRNIWFTDNQKLYLLKNDKLEHYV